jgi:dTDP-4-dehydrorhamnose reductase
MALMRFPLLRRTNRAPTQLRPKILLIGSTGQIGFELLRSLQPLGHVVSTVRAGDGLRDAERSAGWELDLAQPATIRPLVDRLRPQLIVNAAAFTDVEAAEQDPDLAMTVNGVAPGLLAEAARRWDAALVHFSTDYVFDGSGQRRWREEDPTRPLNAYGRSKMAGEEAIRLTRADHLIIRTSWVYGIAGRNFVAAMLRRGCQQPTLRVVIDQVGAPTSARVLADMTAQILALARGCFAPFLGRHGGTLHACCQGETNWHEFAGEVFRLARLRGMPLTIRELEPISSAQYRSAAVRPKNSRLDCQLLCDRFGLVLPPWHVSLALCFEEMFRAQQTGLVPATATRAL